MARIASPLLLTIVLLAGCFGGSEAAAIPVAAGPLLVLQPADLPVVFSQFDGGKLVRADFLPGPREDPQRFGRVGGWKARYRRGGGATTKGPLVVESRADLFGDAGGAEHDLDAYEEQFEQAVAQNPGSASRLSLGDLGEASAGLTLVQPGSPDVRYLTIAWRDENATASVSVSGFDRSLALEQALALARAQQRRIRSAATA